QAGAPAQAVAKFTRKTLVTFVLTVTRIALSVPATLGVFPHPLRHVGVPVDLSATTLLRRTDEATLIVPAPLVPPVGALTWSPPTSTLLVVLAFPRTTYLLAVVSAA